MAKKWTNFLIALSNSEKARDKYRDSTKKAELFDQYGITDPTLLEEGNEDELKAAVEAESGLAQVEWWISSSGAPVKNEAYDKHA